MAARRLPVVLGHPSALPGAFPAPAPSRLGQVSRAVLVSRPRPIVTIKSRYLLRLGAQSNRA
jgi:hypothetical protein